MRLWKAWFDIRQRFFLCIVLVTLLIAPEAVQSAISSARAAAEIEGTGPSAGPETLQAAAQAFDRMLDSWIGGRAHYVFAVLAIVLAVGGILSNGNARSNLMTLSLPAKRRRWLTGQATMAGILVLALCAWEASIMAVNGWVNGLTVPLGPLLLAVLLTSISASLWIWPAILMTSFTRESVRAAIIIVTVLVSIETMLDTLGRQELGPGGMANVWAWAGGMPWSSLAFGTVLAGGSAWWALSRFRRMEF